MNIEAAPTDYERVLRTARRMDALVRIPGTNMRVGLDSLLGLVPVAGDVLALLPSLWILWHARRLGARRRTLARMAANVALDAGIGTIPLAGDLFDLFYKANLRNVALLERDMTRQKTSA